LAHVLSPGIFTRDWFGRAIALANAATLYTYARAAFFNVTGRLAFTAALKDQLGVDLQPNVWRSLAWDLLCVLPLSVVARRGRAVKHTKDIAYADWQRVDADLLARWQRMPKGLKRINAMVGRGTASKWLSLDVLAMEGLAGRDVLMYVHGGGWGVGDKLFAAHALLDRLASRGVVCVSINYRLVPDAPFPAAIEDCKRALHWVKQHATEFGGNPARVFVCGESAGGHLCALLATCGRDYHPSEVDASADLSVAGAIPLYGVFDLADSKGLQKAVHPSLLEGVLDGGGGLRPFVERVVMQKRYVDNKEAFALASPAHRVATATEQVCPFFVVHGTDDSLAAHGGSVEFFNLLKKHRGARMGCGDAFVSLPEAHHQFGYLPSPRAMALADAIARWMECVPAVTATSI